MKRTPSILCSRPTGHWVWRGQLDVRRPLLPCAAGENPSVLIQRLGDKPSKWIGKHWAVWTQRPRDWACRRGLHRSDARQAGPAGGDVSKVVESAAKRAMAAWAEKSARQARTPHMQALSGGTQLSAISPARTRTPRDPTRRFQSGKDLRLQQARVTHAARNVDVPFPGLSGDIQIPKRGVGSTLQSNL